MKLLTFALLAFLNSSYCDAQKATYDIISYSAPAGWKQEYAGNYVSYSKIDGSSWAQMTLYKSTVSKGGIAADLDSEWKEIVEAMHATQNTESTQPATANGWTVASRSCLWPYNGANVATILTTYTNGNVCVSVLCNATAKPYLDSYKALISTIDLNVPAATIQVTATPAPSSARPLTGLWGIYINEISGQVNGAPQLTGGYFRKEYTFFENGTYQFLEKDLSAYSTSTILFGWETGTWSVTGNKITISPKQGKDEEWSKPASGRTDQWGSRVKTNVRKLETITYTFELKYYSGMKETHLLLRNDLPTYREGKSNNMNNKHHEWSYTPQPVNKAMVTPPPGTTIIF